MTPRLWFSLFLRVLGAWTLLGAIGEFETTFNVARGFYRPAYTEAAAFFTRGLIESILALILLKGAPAFAAYFYPTPSPSRETADEDINE